MLDKGLLNCLFLLP